MGLNPHKGWMDVDVQETPVTPSWGVPEAPVSTPETPLSYEPVVPTVTPEPVMPPIATLVSEAIAGPTKVEEPVMTKTLELRPDGMNAEVRIGVDLSNNAEELPNVPIEEKPKETAKSVKSNDFIFGCIDDINMPYELARAFEEVCKNSMFDCTLAGINSVYGYLEHFLNRKPERTARATGYDLFSIIDKLGVSYFGGKVLEGIFVYCEGGNTNCIESAFEGLGYLKSQLQVTED